MALRPEDFEIIPFGNKIYLVLDDIPKKSGLIELTGSQATPTRIGTILACGPECKYAKVGDRVILSVYPGTNLYLWQYGIMDEKWRVMTESEILGKVSKEVKDGDV